MFHRQCASLTPNHADCRLRARKLWGAVWKKIFANFPLAFLAYFKITFFDLGKSEILLN